MPEKTSKQPTAQGLTLFSDRQFKLVQDLCGAPSPVGFEAAMIDDVILSEMREFMPDHWQVHRFVGNPGVVIDTAPDMLAALSVMVVGHADKIRLQVRSIGEDGKIWVNCDSMLPTAIIGHRFDLIIESSEEEGEYRILPNLTAQAIGAIHFSSPKMREGTEGIKPTQIYLETGLFGKGRKKRLEDLGVRAGQPALFSRGVERGPSTGTFQGAYLDNALGCFAAVELARQIADWERANDDRLNVRLLLTFASHEEIGLFGSRIAAGVMRPDVVIAVDVNHDYEAAPGITERKMQRLAMGEGATIKSGTVYSYPLVTMIRKIAKAWGIPHQIDFVGKQDGTDGMAAVNAAHDAAACSIGIPIRNMHTSSELGYDGDVLSVTDLLFAIAFTVSQDQVTREFFKEEHVIIRRTNIAPPLAPPPMDGPVVKE